MALDESKGKEAGAAASKDKERTKEKPDAEKEQLKKSVAEHKDSLQRLQAEFENYKKRIDKENAAFASRAKAELLKSLLPVLDSFEIALKNTGDTQKFAKGVEMIWVQLYSALEDMGLRKIEAAGKPLDPYRHEVLLQEESDKDNVVLEELQKGYMLNDTVLRHSKVKVGKKKENKSE